MFKQFPSRRQFENQIIPLFTLEPLFQLDDMFMLQLEQRVLSEHLLIVIPNLLFRNNLDRYLVGRGEGSSPISARSASDRNEGEEGLHTSCPSSI